MLHINDQDSSPPVNPALASNNNNEKKKKKGGERKRPVALEDHSSDEGDAAPVVPLSSIEASGFRVAMHVV